MITADHRLLRKESIAVVARAEPQISLFHFVQKGGKAFTKVPLAVATIDYTARYNHFAV